MLMGDLNADCGYVTVKGLKMLRLRNDSKFLWLITDEQDTTVRDKTHCAYDRSTTNITSLHSAEKYYDFNRLGETFIKVFHFSLLGYFFAKTHFNNHN